jgi:hypothetical protein
MGTELLTTSLRPGRVFDDVHEVRTHIAREQAFADVGFHIPKARAGFVGKATEKGMNYFVFEIRARKGSDDSPALAVTEVVVTDAHHVQFDAI